MPVLLTQSQIDIISNLIEKKGVNFVDVRHELTDHLASEIEEHLELNKEVDFNNALFHVFSKYDRFYFMNIEDDKTYQVHKQAMRTFFKLFLSFFTFHKIILSIMLTSFVYIMVFNSQIFILQIVLGSLMLVLICAGIWAKYKLVGKGMYLALSRFSFISTIVITTVGQIVCLNNYENANSYASTTIFTFAFILLFNQAEIFYKCLLDLKLRYKLV